jgi:hypothetical protein
VRSGLTGRTVLLPGEDDQTAGQGFPGFSSFDGARRTIQGYEAMNMIRKDI